MRRPVSRRDRVRRALATLVLQVILAPREAVITDLIEERDTRDTGVSESARHEIQILATTAPSHAVEYRARDRLALELEILARETARTLQIIYETRLAAALLLVELNCMLRREMQAFLNAEASGRDDSSLLAGSEGADCAAGSEAAIEAAGADGSAA